MWQEITLPSSISTPVKVYVSAWSRSEGVPTLLGRSHSLYFDIYYADGFSLNFYYLSIFQGRVLGDFTFH